MPATNLPIRRVQKKRVNIDAPTAIRSLRPPILGKVFNVQMSTGDILKCLCKRAKVDEVLPDGTLVRLNMSNYYTDNSGMAKNIPAPPSTAPATPEQEETPEPVQTEPEAAAEEEQEEVEEAPAETMEEEPTAEAETAEPVALSEEVPADAEPAEEEKEEQTEPAPKEEETDTSAQVQPQIPIPQQPQKHKKKRH